MLKLYNTLTRKIELLKSLKGKEIRIYNCGPTVYDYAHIGNLRTFTLQDLLRRYIEFKGFSVKQVMNITDVDDKTIKASREQGTSLSEFTQKFFQEFAKDAKALGIKEPTKTVFATKEIPEMIKIVVRLLAKKIAYKSDDNSVYFDIKKFKGYGKLSKLKLAKLKAGARVSHDSYEKNEARDFVLWKAWQETDGEVFWDAPFGRGRPGWHLECSAMSLKYLGGKIDIHGGGVDLVFPHHENEIAQSESFTGKPVVSHWFHSNHLIVNGKKMSKSLGNFYTLHDLKDNSPRALRLLFFSAHYRDELNFTIDSLKQAENNIAGFDEFVRRLQALDGKGDSIAAKKLVEKSRADFEKNLDNDLDTPKMLAGLHAFIRQANKLVDGKKIGKKEAENILRLLKEMNSVLGVFVFEFDTVVSKEILSLIEEREKARAEKNYKRSDEIRALLLEKGIQLNDTPDGVKWKKI